MSITEIDRRTKKKSLEIELNQIISVVKMHVSYRAIILYGGYGRNEGAWYKRKDGFYPYNDFDILIVVDSDNLKERKLAELTSVLKERISTRFIDISTILTSKLCNLPVTIFNYDLKYASMVLDGDSSVLDYIPNYSVKSIPLKEGEILFFTRLWTFCGSFNRLESLSGDSSRFFKYQMAKAILAVVDVILLINQTYHPSYKKRVEIITSLTGRGVRECDIPLFWWALAEKLSPSSNYIGTEDVEELYFKVAQLYRFYMLKLLSLQHKKVFVTIQDFSGYYRHNFFTNFKRVIYPILKRGSRRFEKIYFSNLVQMGILSHILNEKEDKKSIFRLRKYMANAGKSVRAEWDEIRLQVAELRLE